MAETDIPYQREGEPSEKNRWNNVIRHVNNVTEGFGGRQLEEVGECHRLSKQDIEEAQNVLIEVDAHAVQLAFEHPVNTL